MQTREGGAMQAIEELEKAQRHLEKAEDLLGCVEQSQIVSDTRLCIDNAINWTMSALNPPKQEKEELAARQQIGK